MLLRTLFGTLQLIGRPDEVLLRARRVTGHAAIQAWPALHAFECFSNYLKRIVAGFLVSISWLPITSGL